MRIDLWQKAQSYVGNSGEAYFVAGICQLELLKRNGCRPRHHVLEIGCGALVAGRPAIQYLDADRYVGIEPNTWLVEAARDYFPDMEDIFLTKRPIFLNCVDFDAQSTGRLFDFVLSHSILSHAAHWQLPLFMESLSRNLAPHGVALVSIRLQDGRGKIMGDSMHETWQYPGVSYFSMETVRRTAAQFGLHAECRPEYRQLLMKYSPLNIHDWIRVRRLVAGVAPEGPSLASLGPFQVL